MLTELISRYDTIGHKILDLEAELGSTETHKETLDRLIEEAKSSIQVKDTYTREDAVGILRTINNILKNNRFEEIDMKKEIERELLFHQGLSSKKIDCDNTSFIYLSIADALDLPLAAVMAPYHLLVRFNLDREELNWETTSPRELSDNYYKKQFNISDHSISKGVYLRNLTHSETMSIVYTNRGHAWLRNDNLDKAIADFNTAVGLNHNDPMAYNHRGIAWSRKGDLDKAMADHNIAIDLDPNDASYYRGRGIIWSKRHEFDKAIAEYDIAIGLDPDKAIFYVNKGNALARKHNLKEAIDNYNEAIRIDRNYTWAYWNRGIVNLVKLNLIGAGTDFIRGLYHKLITK